MNHEIKLVLGVLACVVIVGLVVAGYILRRVQLDERRSVKEKQ